MRSFFAVSRLSTGSFTATVVDAIRGTAGAKLVKITSLESISWLLPVDTGVLAVIDILIESLSHTLTESINLLLSLDLKNLLLLHMATSVRSLSISCGSSSLHLGVLTDISTAATGLASHVKLISHE